MSMHMQQQICNFQNALKELEKGRDTSCWTKKLDICTVQLDVKK